MHTIKIIVTNNLYVNTQAYGLDNNNLSTTTFQPQQIVQQRIVTFAIDPVAGREGYQSAIILPSTYMLLRLPVNQLANTIVIVAWL
jgi:hypothetical protein